MFEKHKIKYIILKKPCAVAFLCLQGSVRTWGRVPEGDWLCLLLCGVAPGADAETLQHLCNKGADLYRKRASPKAQERGPGMETYSRSCT